jgi:hypothetical protein
VILVRLGRITWISAAAILAAAALVRLLARAAGTASTQVALRRTHSL